jgi:hypothetical protein
MIGTVRASAGNRSWAAASAAPTGKTTTWVDGELWHATWEGDVSELRRVDPRSGEVQQVLEMPEGAGVSGLESDGADQFFCGGGKSGKVRSVRRPKSGSNKAPRSQHR